MAHEQGCFCQLCQHELKRRKVEILERIAKAVERIAVHVAPEPGDRARALFKYIEGEEEK